VRFATFNVSFFRETEGALVAELATGTSASARAVAEVLRTLRPDVVLLNEFDYDEAGEALRLFHERYLTAPGLRGEPLPLNHLYAAPSNTGVPSGFDLDRSGAVGTAVGSRAYGNDSFGYGVFPGQYGFVVLSRFPIERDAVRSFQKFLWRDMPGARLPDFAGTPGPGDWFSPEALNVVRLSSKNHVDVPLRIGGAVVHLLASHPTPPGFDGPEGRNDKRNHDEVRLWADYIDPARAGYLVDDQGKAGGLPSDAHFVIAGDLNSDPNDGDAEEPSIRQLLEHPRVNGAFVPTSRGGPAAAAAQRGANERHRSDPAADTADFSDGVVGNLRVDYVLPSRSLAVRGGAVLWPAPDEPGAAALRDLSDHHLVWLDLQVPAGSL
jgi:3-phytase